MKKLSNQVKQFITQELAMFSTPQEVVESVKQYFNIQLERQHVFYYDASMNPQLSKKWKAIFEATREKFLVDVAAIPLAKKVVRIKKLSKYVERFESAGNYGKAAELIEQIAKEEGGMFTNRREFSGVGGKPIEIHSKTLEDWEKDADKRRRQAASTLEMFEDNLIG